MLYANGQVMLVSLRHILAQVLTRDDVIAKELKDSITTYNSALSLTSMNADLSRRYVNEEHSANAFRIHENAHHLISPELISDLNNIIRQPRFPQIYIFDPANSS